MMVCSYTHAYTYTSVEMIIVCDLFTGAVVGLEKTSYTVSENVGAVEVCTIVHNSNLPCPIDHPFEVGLLTESDTAGNVENN